MSEPTASGPKRIPPRRRFLRSSGAVVAAAVTPAVTPAALRAEEQSPHRAEASGDLSRRLDLPLLHALAAAVLPSEIGASGVEEALRDFVRWLDGFEPVAELPHPYLSTDRVAYGPPDPAPRWASQLAALDLLAQKSRGAGFADLPLDARRELVAEDLERHGAESPLPAPARAPHVAAGFLARFYSRPAAADLAYGVRINAAGCRDLESGAERPAPLTGAAGGR